VLRSQPGVVVLEELNVLDYGLGFGRFGLPDYASAQSPAFGWFVGDDDDVDGL
jgi:hypothetical protein